MEYINKLKPVQLALLLSVFTFIAGYFISKYYALDFDNVVTLKFCGISSIFAFFFSWLLFHNSESSEKVFEEIEDLYFRAKETKTKGNLIIVESDYRVLRKKCNHPKMNEIWQIIETKKEFL